MSTEIFSDYPSGATPWSITDDSVANTAKTLTKDAVAHKCHYITAIGVTLSGAAAGVDIECVLREDAADTAVDKWKEVIGNASIVGTKVGIVFSKPIPFSVNTTADLVVGAGGAGAITTLNMCGYTK
jgi:hypothetical protein